MWKFLQNGAIVTASNDEMLLRARSVVPTAVWKRCVRAQYGASPDIEGLYRTLKEATGVCEVEVKKSRFVARAWPIADASEAQQYIKDHSDPKADHNCYAYKIEFESKYSDDGEPTGTGGKPIYSAIEAEEIDHVCVLVTRYFGGTKLGVGPLGRAYGDAARECLQSGETVEIRPTVDAVGRMYYHSIFKLNSILKRLNGKIVSKVPTHSGLCVVTFRIEEQYYDDFKCFVYDLTGGQSTLFVRNKTKLH